MKTKWDYTNLADAYLKRPDYSLNAVDSMLKITEVSDGDMACDVGAGVAHLTLMLASNGLRVHAVEPNDAMRANGIGRTRDQVQVIWSEGTGEETDQPNDSFDLVTFGSSFNVCDRQLALKETSRILKEKGWFACMWNHRRLNDPIQSKIEEIIKENVDGYQYGSRREDQTEVIEASGLFGNVIRISSSVIHSQTVEECTQAWRSHATLERQAGNSFQPIISSIQSYLEGLSQTEIEIPYDTHLWLAQLS